MNALEQFRNADWEGLLPRLAAHAFQEVNLLRWRTPKGALPEGKTPEDLVSDAIAKTLKGLLTEETGKGLRKWNPESIPNLLSFLKSVIDSDLSDLVKRREHRKTNYSSKLNQEDAATLLDKSIDENAHRTGTLNLAPDEGLLEFQEGELSEQRYRALISHLYAVCGEDNEESSVLLAIEELIDGDAEITPADIVEKTGYSRDQVKNIKKRITRKAGNSCDAVMSEKRDSNEG